MRTSHLGYIDVITFNHVIVLLPTFSSFGGQRGFFKTLYCCSSRPLNQQNLANRTYICTISLIYPVTVQDKKDEGKQTMASDIVISLCVGLFEVFTFSSARAISLGRPICTSDTDGFPGHQPENISNNLLLKRPLCVLGITA